MEYKIIVISAGHGSTFLIGKLHAHSRVDVVFAPVSRYTKIKWLDNTGLKITDRPLEIHRKLFLQRTRGWSRLDLTKSIEENMVNYLKAINKSETERTTLTGTISRIGPFFKRNKIEGVLAVVRHPLHAMVSYLLHQHPEFGEIYGGINNKSCVDFYASNWNLLTTDLLDGGVPIIRYEYAKEDSRGLGDKELELIFKDWISSKRNYGILKPDIEAYLKSLVANNYFRIYEKWKI